MSAFQKLLITSAIIVALSCAYYFVIFLPGKERARQDHDKLLSQQYSTCITAGYQQYEKDRDYTCSSGGLKPGCVLPNEVEKLMAQKLQSYKDFCEPYKK